MSFSVTCSNCDRRFVSIDDSLIGQQARCKCGTIVELQPAWDGKQGRLSKGVSRSSDQSRSTKKAAPKKRNTTSATAVKTNKTQPPKTAPPTVREKKRPLAPPQSNATSAVAATSPSLESDSAQVEVETEIKKHLNDEPIFDNYADLDQILAAGADRTPLQTTRVDNPFEQPETIAKPNRRGLVGATIGGSTGLLAAVILLITRSFAFEGTPLGWIGQAFYGSYTASFGSGEMTNASTNLFIGFGWWILLLAILMSIASVLLLSRVAIRMTKDRKVLAWSRGLVATLTVVCMFSLLGLLFVQNIHHGNLIRDLNSFSSSEPIEGLLQPAEDAGTFQDIREKYEAENFDFMIGVLTFAVLPLMSFGGVAASLLFDER